jgi:O-antigen ligase
VSEAIFRSDAIVRSEAIFREEPGAPPPPSWSARLIEAGALFLLVFTPLAYGTVEPWSEAIAELVILAMAIVWVLQMLRDWEVRVELPAGWLPGSLFLMLVLLQTLALPAGLLELVSPWTVGLHRNAAAFGGVAEGWIPLSLDPHSTWREGLKLVAVGVFFLILYNTYRTRAQVKRAIWTMIMVGTVLSVFGIVQRMTWNGRFYWVGPEAPHANAFGPFVNRAHFAGLVVVVVPMALALVLAGARRGTRRRPVHSWGDRIRRWNSEESGPTRLIPFLVVVMGGAALVSGSRGGMVALLAALLVMVGLGARGRAGGGRAGRLAVATVLVVLAAIWIGGDVLYGTATRLAEEAAAQGEGTRVQIWQDTLGLATASPTVGIGFGGFGSAFPMVRSIRLPVVYLHAESDWVQLLAEVGALGLGLALLVLLVNAGILLRGHQGHRGSDWSRLIGLAALVVLLGTTLQAVGNFNLAVMSNLIFVALAVCIGVADNPPADL